jgi:hypothetical protein
MMSFVSNLLPERQNSGQIWMDAPRGGSCDDLGAVHFVRPTILFLNEILQKYFLEFAWSDEF